MLRDGPSHVSQTRQDIRGSLVSCNAGLFQVTILSVTEILSGSSVSWYLAGNGIIEIDRVSLADCTQQRGKHAIRWDR
jgi:hypothetical protein